MLGRLTETNVPTTDNVSENTKANENVEIDAQAAELEKHDTSVEGKTREGQPCTPLEVVKHVLGNMSAYTEEEIAGLRNGMYDAALKSHFFSRIALYVQKTLYVVHDSTGIPMSQLTHLASSMEMYKCQAGIWDLKQKCTRQCDHTPVAGFFFCGAHRKDYSQKEGVLLHKKRRSGEKPELMDGDVWISRPGHKRVRQNV